VSLIQSKMQAKNWLDKQLAQEGPSLWRDRDREELAEAGAGLPRCGSRMGR
jgi:hypothetical protein